MLNATAYEFGWKTVLLGLATQSRERRLAADEVSLESEPDQSDEAMKDEDAFHLDDTEMAERLAPNRAQPSHSTPAHAHLMFPMLGRLVR